MSMVEVKVSELTGYALDWAVGVACKDSEPRLYQDVRGFWLVGPFGKPWNPSADWSQGGPLIEKHDVMVAYPESRTDWEASAKGDIYMHYAPTPLIAVCRAVVFKALGDTVQVPEELTP